MGKYDICIHIIRAKLLLLIIIMCPTQFNIHISCFQLSSLSWAYGFISRQVGIQIICCVEYKLCTFTFRKILYCTAHIYANSEKQCHAHSYLVAPNYMCALILTIFWHDTPPSWLGVRQLHEDCIISSHELSISKRRDGFLHQVLMMQLGEHGPHQERQFLSRGCNYTYDMT